MKILFLEVLEAILLSLLESTGLNKHSEKSQAQSKKFNEIHSKR